MGEVIPSAIPMMAKAAQDAGISLSGTVKELMELQQKGEVVSSKVLPFFAKRMSEAARANGGLEAALKSNRVAMNQMVTSMQNAADEFFRSGFSEGLTDFFKEVGLLVKDNTDLWKSLGNILGSALKAASLFVKTLKPLLESLGAILKSLTDILGDFSGILLIAFSVIPIMKFLRILDKLSSVAPIFSTMAEGTYSFAKGVGVLRLALGSLVTMFLRLILPAVALLAVLEEIANIVSPKEGKRTLAIETSQGGKYSAESVFGEGAFTKFLDTPLSDLTSSRLPAGSRMGQVAPNGQPIVIPVTVKVGSEELAHEVINTDTASQFVDRKLQAGFIGSR